MFLKIRLKSLCLSQCIARALVPLDFSAAGPMGAPVFLTFASHHLALIGEWTWRLQIQMLLISPVPNSREAGLTRGPLIVNYREVDERYFLKFQVTNTVFKTSLLVCSSSEALLESKVPLSTTFGRSANFLSNTPVLLITPSQKTRLSLSARSPPPEPGPAPATTLHRTTRCVSISVSEAPLLMTT